MRPVFLLALGLGCESAGKDSVGALTVDSEGGGYTLTVEFSPDPPVVGELTMEVTAPGVSALSVEGAMAGMDHGFTDPPTVSGPDGELWTVDAVVSMSGTWNITFSLDGDAGLDTASMDIEVY